MVEAVVVLPVLIILFVSVFYVRSQVLARQTAESKARACAWAYSMNNCNAIPPGCEQLVRAVDAAGPLNDKIEEKLSNVSGGIAGPLVSSILRPMLDAALGRAVDANTEISYDRPALYGGGTQSAHGGYRLACNLTPETLEQVGMDAWNALSSKF